MIGSHHPTQADRRTVGDEPADSAGRSPARRPPERAGDEATESRPGPVAPTPTARCALRPLPLDAAVLAPSGLLGAWQRRTVTVTIPHCLRELERGGALHNMRRHPGDPAPHQGMRFSDSDIYKTLEAMAWQAGTHPLDDALAGQFAALVQLVAERQEPDGYLNSYYQHDRPDRRWCELAVSHELYCAGHLVQAAVATERAGLGTDLMAVARRFADLIVTRFGPAGTDGVCGHPQIETALVELYRTTGHQPYLALARRFIDLRGHALLGPGEFGSAYFQDHEPVRQATEFTGHAVRQLYLLCGVVDVAVETGDDELLAAAQRLWESAFTSKTYLTGAHGSRHRDESVGDPYELPPDRAYAETCAAIGSFQWNWRLLLATGRHRYADEMERVLYNAIAAATSLDGEHFFYANPLQVRTGHDGTGEDVSSRRLPWYSCACCPPNLARLLASLHAYLATQDATGIQLHLYADATIRSGGRVVEMDTRYPWDGEVTLTVRSTVDDEWTLAVRVPGWCDHASVAVDGVPQPVAPVGGYLRLTRRWTGQRVTLHLAMPPRLVAPHPRIDAVRGCVALARGPLVYSLEQADLPEGTVLEDVSIDVTADVRMVPYAPDATIPVSLTALGRTPATPDREPAAVRQEPLYRTVPAGIDPTATGTVPMSLTAIPYFLWANREPGPMRVWIPMAAGAPLRRPAEDTH